MSTSGATPTLIEDWQARRQRLLGLPGPADPLVQLHVQILDYLIRRYRDSPEAARPARYPMNAALYANERMIVVHHHVWEGKVGGVKTQREAQDRVSTIVRRIVSHRERGQSEPDPDWMTSDQELRPPSSSRPAWARRWWEKVRATIRKGEDALPAIERSLCFCPTLPESAVAYLYRCAADPACRSVRAASLLRCCDNRSVLEYAVRAWRDRVAAGYYDPPARKLRDTFCDPGVRPRALDLVRGRLADQSGRVRVMAVAILGQIGTLDDLGLLSDLLALPRQPDEQPKEREVLVRAMQRISEGR